MGARENSRRAPADRTRLYRCRASVAQDDAQAAGRDRRRATIWILVCHDPDSGIRNVQWRAGHLHRLPASEYAERDSGGHLDRAILGLNHIWTGSVTYDPEGPFSTIPAIGTAMLGIFAGRWIMQRRPLVERIAGLFAVGSLGMVVGLMWNWVFPINKNLWTSSYVVFTAGMACVSLATIMWIVDLNNIKRWTKPFVIYGMNPIVAFVGSGVLARCIYTLWKVDYAGKPTPMETVIYNRLRIVARAPGRVARNGGRNGTVLVRGTDCDVPEEDLPKGLGTWCRKIQIK